MSKPTNFKNLFRTVLMLLLPLAVACTLQPSLRAQSVSFDKAVRTIVTGLNGPADIAVDAAGNVYIADTVNRRVLKVSPSGAQTTVGKDLFQPYGVAVDAMGNVFISDPNNNVVVKVFPDGTQVTVGNGLSYPEGLTVDGAGNLFIADAGAHNYIVKVTPGGVQTIVASSATHVTDVAVDGAGNVYIPDQLANRVLKVSAGGETTVGTGLNIPAAVAVDGAGNVYIGDVGNGRVVKVPAGGGAQTDVASGLTFGVAVDGAGNIFYAFGLGDSAVEVQPASVSLGAANVCSGQSSPAPCSQTLTLNYSISTGGTLGTPLVVTQGLPNLDFKLAAGSTCTGAVTAGASCTVNVIFAPLAPGTRMGAVEVTDSSGHVLATTPVYGLGQGPIVAFGQAVQTALGKDLNFPFGVAVDAAGNVYTADANDHVVKIAPGGAQSLVGTDLSSPKGVAVDGAGNVFIPDARNRVLKVAPNGVQTTVGTGLNNPYAVAVDGAGNLLIADTLNNRVVKVAPDGTQSIVGKGLMNPEAVAWDGAGNVLIADTFNGRVVKVSPNGDQTVVAGGLRSPDGVAVDIVGNVLIAALQNILKVSPDGALTTLADLAGTAGLAVDGAGNVFIGDSTQNRVLELQWSQAPSLSFANTVVGSTSSDSPKPVTIQNAGNQPLNAVAPGIAIGANFQQAPGSGTPADCTANFSLAAGASCNLSIRFVPQTAGAIKSTAVLTDNHLNATAATQSIALSGTGILVTSTTVSGATGQYSDKVTISVLVGPANANFTANLQFQIDGANACLVSVTASGTYTCSYTITQAAGNYSISANLTSTDPLVQGSNGSNTLTVTKEDASIAAAAGNPATVQVNTAGGKAGPITLQGTVQQAADASLGDMSKAAATVTLVPAVAGAANITCPVTNTNGALSATCSNVPVDAYTVQWSIGGNYYQGLAVNSVLAVYDPSLGFVSGSGSVSDNGVAADFSVSVKYMKDNTLSGSITYIEHRATGDVKVSSTSLTSMSLVGPTAIIYGKATVNGAAGYTLQLNMTDNGEPGIRRDTLGLQLSGGTLTPPISFAPAAITAGNIQTH